MDKQLFFLLSFLGCALSIISSYLIIISLNSKKSTYAKIMLHIVITESIYIFAQFLIIVDEEFEYMEFISNYFKILTFGIFKFNADLVEIFRYSTYFAFQSYSLLFNLFMCLEIILILKNPLSQIKTRMKLYYSISSISVMSIFIMSLNDITLEDDRESIFFIYDLPM